jgi:hypothetical protein
LTGADVDILTAIFLAGRMEMDRVPYAQLSASNRHKILGVYHTLKRIARAADDEKEVLISDFCKDLLIRKDKNERWEETIRRPKENCSFEGYPLAAEFIGQAI